MNETAPSGIVPAPTLAGPALARLDEQLLAARNRIAVLEANAAGHELLIENLREELCRRTAELALDRDRWRSRAEKAEHDTPASLAQTRALAEARRAEVTKLAQELVVLRKDLHDVRIHAGHLEHDLADARKTIAAMAATMEGMQRARDQAARLRDEMGAALAASNGELERAHRAIVETRAELGRVAPVVSAAMEWAKDPRRDGAAAALRKATGRLK